MPRQHLDGLSRRNLLAGGGSLLALSTLPGCVTVPEPKAGPPATIPCIPAPDLIVVDPHCHVFNANDLPVKGFLLKVGRTIGETKGWPNDLLDRLERILDPTLSLFERHMQRVAPNGRQEDEDLKRRLGSTASRVRDGHSSAGHDWRSRCDGRGRSPD